MMPNTDNDFPPLDFDSIPFIIEEKIMNIERDIQTLEADVKDYIDNHRSNNPDGRYKTHLLCDKMYWMMPSMQESMILRMQEEKYLYENAFDEKILQGLIDSLENIDIMKSSRPINERIIHARIEILRFRKSGLGEKDYERDISAIKKKIDDVSKYTEVHSHFKFPALPHITLKELVFYLCNTKKNKHIHHPLPIIPKETAKEISVIISEKQRLPRNQKEYDQKELHRVALRSRYGII